MFFCGQGKVSPWGNAPIVTTVMVTVPLVLICGAVTWIKSLSHGRGQSFEFTSIVLEFRHKSLKVFYKGKILAWFLFYLSALFLTYPPLKSGLRGWGRGRGGRVHTPHLPTMKGELPPLGLSCILSPYAAGKPLLEVK